MHGRASEKISAEQRHHAWTAATVLAQINNQRIRIGEKVHGRCGGLARASLRLHKSIKLQVADVAAQALHFLEAEVHLSGRIGARWRPRRRFARSWHRWQRPIAVVDIQVLIVADLSQVVSERLAEGGGASDAVILLVRKSVAQVLL